MKIPITGKAVLYEDGHRFWMLYTHHCNHMALGIIFIGLNKGLSPSRYQTITWTNAIFLWIGRLQFLSKCELREHAFKEDIAGDIAPIFIDAHP